MTWSPRELESLEAVSQDAGTRNLCLRMAALQRAGRLEPLVAELQHDADLDDSTKGMLTELAEDTKFLLAVEEYVRLTATRH